MTDQITRSEETTVVSVGPRLRRHWPLAAGVGFAVLIMLGPTGSGVELAPVLAAAALIYLGAAALQRPAAAWPLFIATGAVIAVGELSGGRVEPTWLILVGALLLLVWGVRRGVRRPPPGVPLQTVAMLGFGAVAGVALVVNPLVGSFLVAAGLVGHAGWDLVHYRTKRVVPTSFAEFCLALDAALALLIMVSAVYG